MRLNNLAAPRAPAWKRMAIALSALAISGIASVFAAQVIYEYDEIGRLRTVTYDDGKQVDYDLDAAGNRTQVKAWNAPAVSVINDVVVWNGTGNFTVSWTAGGRSGHHHALRAVPGRRRR